MPISVTCKACQHSLKVADKLAGKAFKCPQCTTVVRVPTPGGSSPSPAPREQPRGAEPQQVARSAPPKSRRRPRDEDFDDFDDAPSAKPLGDLSIERDVPKEFQERISDELSRGEKLIWVGTPASRVVLIRSLAVSIGGAVMGIIIAIVFLIAMSNAGGKMVIPILIGGALVFGSCGWPFYKLWKSRKTCYAVTSRRAIVWRAGWFGAVEMDNYNPTELTKMRRMMSWVCSGAGDLVFRSVTTVTVTTGKHGGVSQRTTYYGFLDVEDVRDVERVVRETLVDRLVDKLTE